jgi:undecaprenyl phosphate N,N'-diacetylbacillosamine 1-phosphate transferase
MKRNFYYPYFKRFLDLLLSLSALFFLSPFLVLVTLTQILFNGFPIFFIQSRVGKDNKIFKLLKFRTMNSKIGKDGDLLKDSDRKTWFGNFLRKTSIDELPSLINVFKGDMSLIGPRPLLVEYLPFYNQDQLKRHLVRPGLSGLAQINGRNSVSWKRKFELDLSYIHRISFLLDLKILILTLLKILTFMNKDVDASSNVTMEKFKGN